MIDELRQNIETWYASTYPSYQMEKQLRIGADRERDAAQAQLRALRQKWDEVRRRMIRDHCSGTSLASPHFWLCQVCAWAWRYGEPELHEPTCPLVEVTG
mgnify:CR=1 FL=1